MARITKEELLATNPKIEKKFLLINSLLYETPAFEYLLDLVTESGAIAFITDERKIWAQGQYFGGDAFLDKLHFWKTIKQLNDEGEIIQEMSPTTSGSTLSIKSSKGLDITLGQESDYDKDDAFMNFKLNLADVLNTTKFTIEQNATYNLALDDEDKLSIRKYVPCTVNVSSSLLEYDNGDEPVTWDINIGGTDKLTELTITSNPISESLVLDVENNKITDVIKNNTVTEYTVNFSDGTTSASSTFKQQWAYAVWYGSMEINQFSFDANNIDLFNEHCTKYLAQSFSSKTVTITSNDNEYGIFICPFAWKVIFTDTSNGLTGGWEKLNTFNLYTNNAKYQIWKTEQSGLGTIKWKVSV